MREMLKNLGFVSSEREYRSYPILLRIVGSRMSGCHRISIGVSLRMRGLKTTTLFDYLHLIATTLRVRCITGGLTE